MRAALVEAVPNISEGRRPAVVERIARAFAGTSPQVRLLDVSSDPDHHRSVLTLAGPPAAMLDAVVAGAAACAELIDLTTHSGVHPRIGALDVLPFVPLAGATTAGCVELAHAAGRRLAAEVGLPVYFYGDAATRPERAALPAVRNLAFEALATAGGDLTRSAALAPDAGGPGLHPTAGAVAVGVRPFLIAYNVDLDSADVGLARRIAAAVRERDGGLPAVRAIGLFLAHRGRAQVSMNLLDFRVTPPAVAYDAVASLAAQAGVAVAGSELVGLVPEAAVSGLDPVLRDAVAANGQVVERRLAGLAGGS